MDIKDRLNEDNLIVRAAKEYRHPLYDPKKLLNDVSVLELATRVTFNGKLDYIYLVVANVDDSCVLDYIKPIRLADNTIGTEVGAKLVTSGFGRESECKFW